MQQSQVPSMGQEGPLVEEWQPTLVFLPGRSHGQRSLVAYGPWDHRIRHDWATKQQVTPKSQRLDAVKFSVCPVTALTSSQLRRHCSTEFRGNCSRRLGNHQNLGCQTPVHVSLAQCSHLARKNRNWGRSSGPGTWMEGNWNICHLPQCRPHWDVDFFSLSYYPLVLLSFSVWERESSLQGGTLAKPLNTMLSKLSEHDYL